MPIAATANATSRKRTANMKPIAASNNEERESLPGQQTDCACLPIQYPAFAIQRAATFPNFRLLESIRFCVLFAIREMH